VFDYWAKLQSGISVGNLNNLGHFDECIRFRHNTDKQNIGVIRGQYCLVRVQSTVYQNNSSEWNSRFDWREV
jgi:Nose resistant-to-fluoxetine protein, N-terminal domain